MRRSSQPSATQLAGLCILGGLIAAAGLIVEAATHATRLHHPHSTHSSLFIALGFATVVLGVAISLFANHSLGNGIAAAHWSDEEVDSLRTLLNSRRANLFLVALALLLIVSLATSLARPHLNPLFWSCFILGQSVLWLRNTLSDRQASNPSPQPKWNNPSPSPPATGANANLLSPVTSPSALLA